MNGSDPYDPRRLKQSFHGFWAFFHFEGAENSCSEKKCNFLKIEKDVNSLSWSIEIAWDLVYIRRNRWKIAFPSLKKTHFKVGPTSLFFYKRRKSAQCAICVRLPRCRLSDRFWAGEKRTIEWSALSSQRVFLRARFNSAARVSSQTHQFSVCCYSMKSSS